jgi:hypothetical protein
MSRFDEDDSLLLIERCAGDERTEGGREGDLTDGGLEVFRRLVEELLDSRLIERRWPENEARLSLIISLTTVMDDLRFLTVVFVASEAFDGRRSLDNIRSCIASFAGTAR